MASGVTGSDTLDQDVKDDVDGFFDMISAISVGGEKNENLQKAFMKICRDGLEDRLDVLLKHGVDVDGSDGDGRTCLMWACQFGHRNIVDLLIKSGANVDASDNERKTPLMMACQYGREQVVELLLKYVSDIDAMNDQGYTALMFACENGNESVVNMLLDRGADLKYHDKGSLHGSPLLSAIRKNQINIVRLLIDRGYDVNIASSNGLTALIVASSHGNGDIVELLLQNGADIHATWGRGSALTECWQRGDTDVLEILLKHGANVNEGVGEKESLLMAACRFEYVNVVEILLKYGADVNATDNVGTTALMAITFTDSDIPDIKIAEILLQNGADVNATSYVDQMTALMVASRYDLDTFVELFVLHGADTEAQMYNGSTALMYAAEQGSPKCLTALINAGANTDITNNDGLSILSCSLIAHDNPRDCLEILLERGVLHKDGNLKDVHKNADYSCSSDSGVLATIDLGIFEWEFCNFPCKETCLAALKSGYCPGKMTCYHFDDMKISPLIAAFLDNDTESIETFLKYRYYFPEDYSLLATNDDIRACICDLSFVDEFTLQPLSLFTWSFFTVSKAISLTGHHTSRRQRIETLLIPDSMKKVLTFQIMD